MISSKYKPVAVAALVLAATLFCLVPASASQIAWMGYEEGIASGKASQKKVLINFYADWCTWCKKLDKETFSDKSVVDYLARNFVAVKVDSDRRQDLATAYGVQGLPTMWFVTDQGEPISALPSFVPADTFLSILRYIHTESYNRMKFQEFVKSEGQTKK